MQYKNEKSNKALQMKAPHSPRLTRIFPLTPGPLDVPLASREDLAGLAQQMALQDLLKLGLP